MEDYNMDALLDPRYLDFKALLRENDMNTCYCSVPLESTSKKRDYCNTGRSFNTDKIPKFISIDRFLSVEMKLRILA